MNNVKIEFRVIVKIDLIPMNYNSNLWFPDEGWIESPQKLFESRF